MGQLGQGRSLVPALEPSCCVGAKQPQQRNVLAEASAKGSKSLDGVGAATAMKLLIVDFRPRQGRYGLLKHGEAMRRGHVARGLERRLARGQETKSVGASGRPSPGGHGQVASMNWIEGAAVEQDEGPGPASDGFVPIHRQ
jgi:hypothetical protein